MYDLTKAVYIDFESDNTAGLGLTYYSPKFRITSASFIVDGATHFTTDLEEIKECVRYFVSEKYTIICYNAAFDSALIKHVFKQKDVFGLTLDAWRIFNYCCLFAGDKENKKKRKTSLPAAVEYLFGIEDYKKPYLDKIIELGLAKTEKEAHSNIGQLPVDMLEAYNNLDTYYCKAVLEECLKRLTDWDIDWKPDYEAFIREVELYSDAYVRGIKIDKCLITSNIEELKKKIGQCDKKIRTLPEVITVEAMLNSGAINISKVAINKWKKHKQLPKDTVLTADELTEVEAWVRSKKYRKFNMNSTKQKKVLFLDILGLPVVKLTKTGTPAMSKSVMKEYGETGKLFSMYQNLTKQLEEAIKIDEMSNEDGRIHQTLRSGSTITSRSSSKA